MPFEGYTDFASATEIRGWVYDTEHPDRSLPVEIVQNDVIVAAISADIPRADLLAAGKGNGKHAFDYSQPATGSTLPLVARVGNWLIPLGQFLSPSRYQGKFNHPMDRGFPDVETGFIPTSSDDAGSEVPRRAGSAAHATEFYGRAQNRRQIMDRLIASYHRAITDQPRDGNLHRDDMWSNQMDSGHREIADLLMKNDADGAWAYLNNAHAQSLTTGISQGDITTGILRARADARQRVAAPFVDYLVSLSEFLGLLKVECSDQVSTWGDNLYQSPQGLVDRISAAVGIDIVPPQVIGSLFGIQLTQGILSGRDLLSLHTAIRLKEISQAANVPSPTVCEIGGGMGGVAYYANRLGIRSYTIIDLPIVNVLQGFYLLRTLPTAIIQLYGESTDNESAIRLLPTYCFDSEAISFDILLNQDSMPELHRDYSLAYLRAAKKKMKHLFLSVNQEAQAAQTAASQQAVVADLIREVGGYQKLSRDRHWIRAGYVEELYRSDPESVCKI